MVDTTPFFEITNADEFDERRGALLATIAVLHTLTTGLGHQLCAAGGEDFAISARVIRTKVHELEVQLREFGIEWV